MKKILGLVLALTMAAGCLAGCDGKDDKDSSSKAKAEKKVTVADKKEDDKNKVEVSSKEDDDITDVNIGSDDLSFFDYFEDYNAVTNYLTHSTVDLEVALVSCGYGVKLLDSDTIDDEIEFGKNEGGIYKFTMYNQVSAGWIDDYDGGVYATELDFEGKSYLAVFGDEYSNPDDVEFYTSEGTTAEYYVIAVTDDAGQVVLFPIVAGTEDTGYYAVNTVWNLLDMVLEDYDEDDDNSTSNDKPKTQAQTSNGLSDDSIIINITKVNAFDGITDIDFELTNNTEYNITSINDVESLTATLNGKDITDEIIIYLRGDAFSTDTDDFTISHEVEAGDVIVIKTGFADFDSCEYIGSMEFTINIT